MTNKLNYSHSQSKRNIHFTQEPNLPGSFPNIPQPNEFPPYPPEVHPQKEKSEIPSPSKSPEILPNNPPQVEPIEPIGIPVPT